jgi:phage-related protein
MQSISVLNILQNDHFLFNRFQKKSQKTPPEEIDRALKIKAEYFIEKIRSKGHGSKM